MDKHIRRFLENGVVDRLLNAETSVEFFEAGHAMKGVCANLGLTGLAEAASEITEEFRPGNERKLSDAEVLARIEKIRELYNSTAEGIQRYIMS
jgi:HPt (histidine-containing phosphotransfer) domain-containing protein